MASMKILKWTSALLVVSLVCLSAEGWERSASLGVNIAKGNNDTQLINAAADAGKVSSDRKITYGLKVNVGEESKVTTTDNYSLNGQYNRNFSARAYWLVQTSLNIDKIADLDRRLLLGPGLGLSVIKSGTDRMDVEAGVAYLSVKYEGAAAENDLAYRLAENYNHKFSKSAKFWQLAEFLGNFDSSDAWIFKGTVGVESSLSGGLSLRSYLEDTYNHLPAAGKKQNDLSIVTMLVYKF